MVNLGKHPLIVLPVTTQIGDVLVIFLGQKSSTNMLTVRKSALCEWESRSCHVFIDVVADTSFAGEKHNHKRLTVYSLCMHASFKHEERPLTMLILHFCTGRLFNNFAMQFR